MTKVIRFNDDKNFNEKEIATYDNEKNWLVICCYKNNEEYILDLDFQNFDDVKELYNCLGQYINKRGEYDD